MEAKVVITGLGVVSSIGIGIDSFTQALREGRSGASPITVFDTSGYERPIGCEVRNFDAGRWFQHLNPEGVGRSSQFAVAAARMAMVDAGLSQDVLRREGTAVSIGTTDGESQVLDQLAAQWAREGLPALDPELIRQAPASRMAISIAQEFALGGEAATFSTACAAGNYAIGYAYDLLRSGQARYALCGGADSMCRKTYAGFHRLGTIAPECCQPFDKHRLGILTGEGAGILLLERLDDALARGARIYAQVLGYGLNCDARHMVSPNRESIAECIRIAHRNARVDAREVDYICAHGTGTMANDTTKVGAICDVFGAQRPPVSSIKSMLGHTMGAASAIASVACASAIHNRYLPPTINHRETDPACPVDCVPNRSRQANLRVVQNNGFAFGGNNAILMFGTPDTGVSQ
jgi:3-oxoacyl-[acyl-carrier-protein] synthase II